MNKVIAEIQKKPQEKLRITLSRFRQGLYLDIRTLYDTSENENQNWVITKRGVNIPLELLPELIASLRKVERLDLIKDLEKNEEA